MKMNWMNVKNLISKIAMVVVAVGGTATITGCTTLFHEKKISNELLENHPFATKK